MLPTLRAIVIVPDSNGWRSESRTPTAHSGASSIKRTPWCASEHAPGFIACEPPPTMATRDAL